MGFHIVDLISLWIEFFLQTTNIDKNRPLATAAYTPFLSLSLSHTHTPIHALKHTPIHALIHALPLLLSHSPSIVAQFAVRLALKMNLRMNYIKREQRLKMLYSMENSQ